MSPRLKSGACVLCGHSWEAHITGRCDTEARDYCDTDCGCEGAFRIDFAAGFAAGVAAPSGEPPSEQEQEPGDNDGT